MVESFIFRYSKSFIEKDCKIVVVLTLKTTVVRIYSDGELKYHTKDTLRIRSERTRLKLILK
jgi:hypothetical protein